MAEKVAGGAKGFYILGLISEQKKKNKDALLYYKRSFKLDPSLWVAFEKICQLDYSLSVNITDLFSVKTKNKIDFIKKPKIQKKKKHLHTPRKINIAQELKDKFESLAPYSKKAELKRVKHETRDCRKKIMEGYIMKNHTKLKNKIGSITSEISKKSIDFESMDMRNKISRHNLTFITKRGSPERSQSTSKSKELQMWKRNKILQENISFVKNKPSLYSDCSKNKYMEMLKKYLMKLGYAYRMLTVGKFKESINIFNSLDSPLLTLHFVLINTAICYMHLVKYKNAEKLFSYAFEKEPFESYGLDFYRYIIIYYKIYIIIYHKLYFFLIKQVHVFGNLKRPKPYMN